MCSFLIFGNNNSVLHNFKFLRRGSFMSGVNYTNVNIRGTEMKKICPNCKKEKLLSEFGTRTMENGDV
jgi:hypothetical protein